MWNNNSCGCGQESPSHPYMMHQMESPAKELVSPTHNVVNPMPMPMHGLDGHFMNPSYQMCGHTQVAPAYYMDNQYSCGDHGYKGSSFVLIVVLFILLIIVGKCYL